ncbi:hypothetical protein V2G26_016623 [Clonostachys chloroleuca]
MHLTLGPSALVSPFGRSARHKAPEKEFRDKNQEAVLHNPGPPHAVADQTVAPAVFTAQSRHAHHYERIVCLKQEVSLCFALLTWLALFG